MIGTTRRAGSAYIFRRPKIHPILWLNKKSFLLKTLKVDAKMQFISSENNTKSNGYISERNYIPLYIYKEKREIFKALFPSELIHNTKKKCVALLSFRCLGIRNMYRRGEGNCSWNELHNDQ